MKLLRVLLTWILMLAVPASGWAALNTLPAPCPMHTQDLGITADALDSDSDCCADSAHSGMASCAQKCPTAPVALPMALDTSVRAAAVHVTPRSTSATVTDGAPSSLWRPPRQA